MTTLKTRDLMALGFMTFALFLGAGNIIFPPIVGLAAGEHLWSAALGFLLTGVGLPLVGVVQRAFAGVCPLAAWPACCWARPSI